jgi:tetratricopeptide (TPR) repeat protein
MRRAFLCIPVALLLLLCGCHKKSSPVVPALPTTPAGPAELPPEAVTPPPPPKPAALESAPLPKTIAAPNYLELGETNFQLGRYRQAIRAYEAFLSANQKSAKREQAWFYLGLSRVLTNDASRDLRKSESAFRRLIAEFPASPFRSQAEFILGLHDQIEKLRSDVKDRDEKIKKLSEELQTLKNIDMQRRPSKPPQ